MFNDFMKDLQVSEERVNNINAMAHTLAGSGHRQTEAIRARCNEINKMWAEVKDLAQARQEVRC